MASSRDRPLLVFGIAIAVLGLGATPASALMRASVELYEGQESLVITSEEASDGVKSETLSLSDTGSAPGFVQVSVNGGADQVFPIGPECVANGLTQADCVIPVGTEIVVDLRRGSDTATSTTAQTVRWLAGFGDDTISGGPGTDVFFAGEGLVDNGADTFAGGGGLDVAQYQARTGNLVIRLDGVANDGYTGENDDIEQDVESIVSGSGFDTIVGSPSPQIITGGPGDDTIDGGAGPDIMFGGPGTDTVTYAGRNTPVDADPTGVGDDGSTTDENPPGGGGARDTIRDDVERLIGTNGGDTLRTGGVLRHVEGGPGADTLISGPEGGDLFGQTGNDTLIGGPAVDMLAGGADDDVISGGGNTDFLDGRAGDDDLRGEDGDDRVTGGPGDDSIDGGVGADVLVGQAGSDTLVTRDLAADDTINCGADVDVAVVDFVDPATVECETVDRAAAPVGPDPDPGPSPGPGTPTPPAPPPGGVGGAGTTVPPILTPPVIARAPAKIRVLRAGIRDGRLDLRLEITSAATGSLDLEYHSAGKRTRFRVAIPKGSGNKPTAWSLTRRLPSSQRRTTTGILTLTYAGDARVRPDDVRLRAANGRALMERGTVRLGADRRLRVGGTISSRAVGVVRIRLGYVGPDGKVAFLRYRARIRREKGEDRARWSIDETVPAAAAAGGQLSIQFTGYLPRRIRGEQTSKAVTPAR